MKIMTAASLLLFFTSSVSAEVLTPSTDDVSVSDRAVRYTGQLQESPTVLAQVAEDALKAQADAKKALVEARRVAVAQKKAAAIRAQVWRIKMGDDIRASIDIWAKSTNWQLEWKAKKTYISNVNASFNGSVVDAVDELLLGINLAEETNFQATAHKKNRVLRIHGE